MTIREAAESKEPDKDTLLALFKETNTNVKWIVDKMWNSVNFFTTLSSALISLTVLAAAATIREQLTMIWPFFLLLGVLPLTIISLSLVGIANLRREYSRFLDYVVLQAKLQEKIGLNAEMDFRIFPKDKFLLPERFSKHPFSSSDDFHQAMMRKRSSILYYFTFLHWIYIALSFIVISMMVSFYIAR
jgi:hypothetical protein